MHTILKVTVASLGILTGMVWPQGAGAGEFDLPDDGPRYETPVVGAGSLLFEQGAASYGRGEYAAAEIIFRRLLTEFPKSELAEPAKAFVAESLAHKGSPQDRKAAADLYRALVREHPKTTNGSRARWRIGDIYAEQRWDAEAKAAYEQAAAQAISEADAARASVGLGVNLMRRNRWPEAAAIFTRLVEQGQAAAHLQSLIPHATMGLADASYELQRFHEARSLYDGAFRRWPDFFKGRPRSLLRCAEALRILGDEANARRFYVLFYNLYPKDADAAPVLIRLADSWRRTGVIDRASLLYETVAAHDGKQLTGPIARMRLTELGQQVASQSGDRSVRLAVQAAFRVMPSLNVDPAHHRTVFRSLADTHDAELLGSEARFHLGEHFEWLQRWPEAVDAYRTVSDREGQVPGDPWPDAARHRLAGLLEPWIAAALRAHDDVTAVTLFHRHGRFAELAYPGRDVLLQIAEAHRRLGFASEAVKLYQALLHDRSPQTPKEEALMGLGRTYLDQQDAAAASRVFERYLFQYPLGRWQVDAWHLFAVTHHRRGDTAAAIRLCRRWLQRFPAPSQPLRPAVLRLLATSLDDHGDTAEALTVFAQAEEAGALGTGAGLIRYADRLAQAGRPDDAVQRYRKVAQADPGSVDADWARIRMANILRAQKRYAEMDAVLKELHAHTADELMNRLSSGMQAEVLPRSPGA